MAFVYKGTRPVGGNFNEVLKSREIFGSNNISNSRSNHFWSCLNQYRLIDLGFKGSKYTWSNKRDTNRKDLILERLDRCFATDDWIESYPESSITHFPKTHSDQFPLLLSITNQNHIDHSRPLRLESMWCSHPDFPIIVQNSFNSTDDLLGDTNIFKVNVTTWNRLVFGNIFYKKNHILARLNGIQKSNAYPFSTFLQNLEANLQAKFSVILKREEDFWIKSRVSWLCEGDANTRFFHTTTLNRRKRNRILSLTDKVGNQITEPKLIRETTRGYFKNLFTTSHTSSTYKRCYSEGNPLVLTNSMRVSLDQPLKYSEIKKAMNCFKPLMALGPDGMHPFFYQKYLSILSTMSTIFSRRCSTPNHAPEVNKTLLCLIPKCHNATLLKSFGLCNTIYKLVIKIIVNRIKAFLQTIIEPSQAIFLSNRRATDNAIIVQ
ncbi:uncharacterized protein LOC142181829 [Nicotiana tabacum]|uniref:Uncharacterized protein LOC142181829 n=1 Tax=Nicotiana tabacum TaxID=4097 RepID=A0AC58UPU3_TOBAC